MRRERVQRNKSSAAHGQGVTIGVAQGAGSLASILGLIFATATLHYLPPLPSLTCTVILLGTTVVFVGRMSQQPQPAGTADTTGLAK